MLPFAPAAERNKDAIRDVLGPHLADRRRLLEIGSGTGQHAVHMTGALPHLVWQCSDLPGTVPGIAARLEAEGNERTPPPLALDVAAPPWPVPDAGSRDAFDAIFTANTLHIMSFAHVERFFARVGEVLAAAGILAVYGPMKYGGDFTTQSNAEFDAQLRTRDPQSGIRDFEVLDDLAYGQGLTLAADNAMPANNRLLVWQRGTR
jgi:SAM-dependent methyltransferase